MSAKNSAPADAVTSRKRIVLAFSLSTGFAAIEVIGGLQAASLALLADAVHMLIYASLLALVLTMEQHAEPAMPVTASGRGRLVLIVLMGCAFFPLLTAYILYEAYQRSPTPPDVHGGIMLVLAIGSLVINLVNIKLVGAQSSHGLRGKSTWVYVLNDTLGSLQVIVTAIIVMLTGWSLIDSIVGAAIGLYVIPRTWFLANQAIRYRKGWR